jgi:hypothetical protein
VAVVSPYLGLLLKLLSPDKGGSCRLHSVGNHQLEKAGWCKGVGIWGSPAWVPPCSASWCLLHSVGWQHKELSQYFITWPVCVTQL